jgi:hypothetical protein
VQGKPDPAACEFASLIQPEEVLESASQPHPGRVFPAALSLGLEEAAEIMSTDYTYVIAMIGFQDAGKTSVLVSLFSLVLHGKLLPEYIFAGTRTMMGLNVLAKGIRNWSEARLPSRIMPRTSTQMRGRNPGFLHFRFQLPDGAASDFLFSDVPGEWYDDWVNQPQSGADRLNFIERANALVLLIEGPKVSNIDTRHPELANFGFLLRRAIQKVKAHRVPIMVLITKCDEVPVTEHKKLRQLIMAECERHGESPEIYITAAISEEPKVLQPGAGIREFVTALIQKVTAPRASLKI